MYIAKGKIGNALTSTAADHILGVADDIFDENQQRYQQDINEDLTLSDDDNSDLSISDTEGNAIARFKNGHVKTQKFDSSVDASEEQRGLMSVDDKKKLEACVITDASPTKRGLMTAKQVSTLYNAMQRAEVGYFSAIETFAEGTNAVLEIFSTTSTAGTVVFCNRIGPSAGASFTFAGFAYKVNGKYYAFPPGAYPKPMPHRDGIAINTTDGNAYVLTTDGQLAKLLPVATTSTSGLLSTTDKQKLNGIEEGAQVNETNVVNGEDADLDISDEHGNAIARFKNGHIQTQKFNSETDGQTSVVNGEDADLDISDEHGNVIMRLKDGHIQTQKFNSETPAGGGKITYSIIKNL